MNERLRRFLDLDQDTVWFYFTFIAYIAYQFGSWEGWKKGWRVGYLRGELEGAMRAAGNMRKTSE